jgi:hypothetical protein
MRMNHRRVVTSTAQTRVGMASTISRIYMTDGIVRSVGSHALNIANLRQNQ